MPDIQARKRLLYLFDIYDLLTMIVTGKNNQQDYFFSFFNELLKMVKRNVKKLIIESGGAGEFHPHAPTDPDVTVSRHTALITQPPRLHGGFILSLGSSHLWLTKQ